MNKTVIKLFDVVDQTELPEMFIVRHTYEQKAQMYARMHGSSTFAGGGEYGDLLNGCYSKQTGNNLN